MEVMGRGKGVSPGKKQETDWIGNVAGGAKSFIQATPRPGTYGSRWTLVSFTRTGNARRGPHCRGRF